MRNRYAWFDSMMDAADRYLDSMAGNIHNEEAAMAKAGLLEMIADGRQHRKRDVLLQADALARKEKRQRSADAKLAPPSLADVYAREEGGPQ